MDRSFKCVNLFGEGNMRIKVGNIEEIFYFIYNNSVTIKK